MHNQRDRIFASHSKFAAAGILEMHNQRDRIFASHSKFVTAGILELHNQRDRIFASHSKFAATGILEMHNQRDRIFASRLKNIDTAGIPKFRLQHVIIIFVGELDDFGDGARLPHNNFIIRLNLKTLLPVQSHH